MSATPRAKSSLSVIHPAEPEASLVMREEIRESAKKQAEGSRTKITFRIDDADANRLRSAVMATGHLTGDRTVNDFVLGAVLDKLRNLEEQHNDGEPWAGYTAGDIPTGRPLRR